MLVTKTGWNKGAVRALPVTTKPTARTWWIDAGGRGAECALTALQQTPTLWEDAAAPGCVRGRACGSALPGRTQEFFPEEGQWPLLETKK